MSTCKFCGRSAGMFRSQHVECAARHSAAIDNVLDAGRKVATGSLQMPSLLTAIQNAKDACAKDADLRGAIIRAWESAVDHFLDDGSLDQEEERHLATYKEHWSLTQQELDRAGALTKIVKAGVLRDIINGSIPSRVTLLSPLPFNFQKNEQLVWVFTNVEYLEDRVRREYVGRSSGVSVRIAKGMYYRVGAFRGRPVERTHTVSLGRGTMAVTTKHIYFAGPKSLRIRHDKVVTHTPYSDGVAVVRDAATAKPQVFITGDGWFTYNLLMNLNQL